MDIPLNDGNWLSGLDSGSYELTPGFYQWAQNVTNRGGIIGTRQGFAQITGRVGEEERPRGMALFAPFYVGVNPQLIVAIGDSVYAINPPYRDALDDAHKIPNITFPTSSRAVNFEVCVQAQTNTNETVANITPRFILIMQDGITAPAYYYYDAPTRTYKSGHTIPTARNSDSPPWNTPIGGHMKWAGDRLWVAVNNKLHASDLLNPLQFEEEKVTASGGFFFLPGNCSGMGVTHDYKSLLVFTEQTTSAFQSGIEDRTTWPGTQDFQRVLFPNIGCVSDRTIVNQYGMTWWVSHDGLVSLDASLLTYQTSRMQVRDHNMSRSKEGLNWRNGGGCAGSFGNWLFFSVPSGSKYNVHTWVIDQSVQQNLHAITPPAWCSNWTGIRPEQWVTGSVNGEQRCFCLSHDLVPAGHQATVWEAFIGQRMDVPKDGVLPASNRLPKDIGCALETRFLTLGPDQYARFRYAKLKLAEIIGNVHLQVFYCGRMTSYKKILDKQITANVSNTTEVIFDPDDLINVYVPQFRAVRTETDTHDSSDNDTGIQTPYLRNIDTEFSLLVTWSGQMSVSNICMYVEPWPDYNEGACENDELTVRSITAEGTGSISETLASPNTFVNAFTSKYLAPLRPRWIEFPAYDSAVANGVFFVDIPTFAPVPGGYPLADFSPHKDISISTESIGDTIVYTKDGTIPKLTPLNGIIYTVPVQITVSDLDRNHRMTLKARGFSPSSIPSAIAEGVFSQAKVATPLCAPSGGQHPATDYPISVAIHSSTPAATIRYTTNGANVTTSSPIYSAPINVTAGMTVKAKGFKTSYLDSDQSNETYTIQPAAIAPVFNPVAGAYLASEYPKSIAIMSATAGSVIRYTINDTDMTNALQIANGARVIVSPDDTLRAVARKGGLADSQITSGTYTATIDTVETPVLHPGSFSGPQHDISVRFNCATIGAQIIYNIGNQTPPDPTAAQHDGVLNDGDLLALHLGHKIIIARAVKAGLNDSDVILGEYQYDNNG